MCGTNMLNWAERLNPLAWLHLSPHTKNILLMESNRDIIMNTACAKASLVELTNLAVMSTICTSPGPNIRLHHYKSKSWKPTLAKDAPKMRSLLVR